MKSKVDMARNNETRLKNVYKRKIEYRSKILFYLLDFLRKNPYHWLHVKKHH